MRPITSHRAALAVAAVALAAVAIIAALASFRSSRPADDTPAPLIGQDQASPDAAQKLPAHTGPASAGSGSSTLLATAVEARPEPSPFARRLVATLSNLDFTQGPITEEQAAKWKHTLQRLIEQGPEAVPAIREFLAQNHEL